FCSREIPSACMSFENLTKAVLCCQTSLNQNCAVFVCFRHGPVQSMAGSLSKVFSSAGVAAYHQRSCHMEIRQVGVVGCGLMGSGIAQVAAMAGLPTVVREVSQPLLDKGLASIQKSLGKFVEKSTLMNAQAAQARARLQPTLKLADLAECDLVI